MMVVKSSFGSEIILLVKGEHGFYVVSVAGDRIKCTCPSYMYRGTCKHVEEVRRWLSG